MKSLRSDRIRFEVDPGSAFNCCWLHGAFTDKFRLPVRLTGACADHRLPNQGRLVPPACPRLPRAYARGSDRVPNAGHIRFAFADTRAAVTVAHPMAFRG